MPRIYVVLYIMPDSGNHYQQTQLNAITNVEMWDVVVIDLLGLALLSELGSVLYFKSKRSHSFAHANFNTALKFT